MKRKIVLVCTTIILTITSVAFAEVVDRIVAKVGGEVITQSELVQIKADRKAQLLRDFGPKDGARMYAQFEADAINEVILERLLSQELKREGIKVTDKDLEQEFQIKLNQLGMTQIQLQDQLAKQGQNLAEYKEGMRFQLERQQFIQKKIMPQISISDFDLQKEYEATLADYMVYEKLNFTEVFLTLDKFESPEAMNAMAEKIYGLLSRKQYKPAQDLIRQHSSGAFAAQGGASGDVVANQLRPEIQEVLSRLPEGGLSKPLPVGPGVFIFLLHKKLDPKPLPFTRVAAQVRGRFGQKVVDQELRRYLLSIKDQTYVELTP